VSVSEENTTESLVVVKYTGVTTSAVTTSALTTVPSGIVTDGYVIVEVPVPEAVPLTPDTATVNWVDEAEVISAAVTLKEVVLNPVTVTSPFTTKGLLPI
jgi:hypothetical protein